MQPLQPCGDAAFVQIHGRHAEVAGHGCALGVHAQYIGLRFGAQVQRPHRATEPASLIGADVDAFQSGAVAATAGHGTLHPAGDVELAGVATDAQVAWR